MPSPLSARSVIASTLLGTFPPRLPGRLLVAFAEEFDVQPGTTRVALTRMVERGELIRSEGGVYGLSGHLLDRQRRQEEGIAPEVGEWSGSWEMLVVPSGRRSSGDRAALRRACRHLSLREMREGMWIRPDNLSCARAPAARSLVEAQAQRFVGLPDGDPVALAHGLFELDGWARRARRLVAETVTMTDRLDGGGPPPLAAGFELAAATLRHLIGDPLLPDRLCPPHWPAAELRESFRDYNRAYRAELATFFRSHRPTLGA